MNKFLYIVFFTLVGFFTNPSEIYACGSKPIASKNSCCSKMEQFTLEDTNCSDNEPQKPCDGSCNSSNCNYTPVFTSYFYSFIYEFASKKGFISSKKASFFYLEKNISLNYFAIWSPPKIS
jgi:hypothetical protein